LHVSRLLINIFIWRFLPFCHRHSSTSRGVIWAAGLGIEFWLQHLDLELILANKQ